MSWATTFWNLDYIIDSARRAMEAAYFAEPEAAAHAGTVESTLDSAIDHAFEPSSDVSGGDALQMMESALVPNESLKPVGDLLEKLAVSMRKESLTTKQPIQPQVSPKLNSPWTPEIEAALRAFLRPLSMNLRHEYGFLDAFNEMRSIETMNSLFKKPAKPDDVETRDLSARDEIRRKRNHELRRSGTLDPSEKRHAHKILI